MFPFPQEGEKLSSDEFLTPCPRCEDPARVNKTSKLALCVNRSCEYAFCTSCFCPYTLDSPHTCPQAPPTPRTRRKYCSMNTKRSKANLKRLLRWWCGPRRDPMPSWFCLPRVCLTDAWRILFIPYYYYCWYHVSFRLCVAWGGILSNFSCDFYVMIFKILFNKKNISTS